MTVSELNRAVAGLLERNIPVLTVRGELSNVTRAASGHWYFTLKDAAAQVRAVMFRGRNQHVGFQPREGMQVEVRALASFYEARGEFQLNVEAMRQAGAGDLYQQFLRLKQALQDEGLFDEARKRVLPALPRCIGVITSPSAAALRDVLTTLRRRAPHVPVIVYPSQVQGLDAPAQLRRALAAATTRAECDVLLIVRGGGSIEDLWAFNDEQLARAVAASPIPVVSGVGHETDFTIVDFVSDLRAPTPTAAAAAASPLRSDLLNEVATLLRALSSAVARQHAQREQRLDAAVRLLRPPSAQWAARLARVDSVAERLRLLMAARIQRSSGRLERTGALVRRPNVEPARQLLRGLRDRMRRSGVELPARLAERTTQLAARLSAAGPEQVLARGYAIVQARSGAVVRAAEDVRPGEGIEILLSRGGLGALVETLRPDRGVSQSHDPGGDLPAPGPDRP